MMTPEVQSRRKVLFWMLFSLAISVVWGYAIERSKDVGLGDFRAVYYGARTVILHRDPYKPDDYMAVYRQEHGDFPLNRAQPNFWRAVPLCVNLPTTLFVIAPFAVLGWGPAHFLWMLLMPAGLFLAAWLAWDLAADYGAKFSLLLLCILLANSEVLLQLGNATGVAVGLCVVAVWCFLRQRYGAIGDVCLGLALALKPQEVGFIWLYFLLAGGNLRRRSLQSLGITAAIAVLSLFWIETVSPEWLREWHSNVATTSVHGDLNDPGPTSIGNLKAGMTINLQAVISYFRDDPRFYNPASYLICAPLLLAWGWVTLRTQFSREKALLALASISALSMLPVYHRQYDVKLLVLTVPAMALLWREGRRIRITALFATAAGIVFTSDIPVGAMLVLSKALGLPQSGLSGALASIFTTRIATLALMVVGVFYLWAYIRRARNVAEQSKRILAQFQNETRSV